MHENCSHHLLLAHKEEPILEEGIPKQEGIGAAVPNNINFSEDNSNLSEDKSNKLPDRTAEDSNQKENKPEETFPLGRKASMEEENLSEKHSDYDKKSEPTKNDNKDPLRSNKNISAKCWNKLCLAKGIKKIKSKVTGRYVWLCTSCSNSYCLEQYCEFCEQIYAQEEVDGL